jgi:ABC-2 type transport system permease protein
MILNIWKATTMTNFLSSFIDEIKLIYKYRFVISAFTGIKLKQKYRRSVLGYFWTIFTPLINYMIMGGVISMIAKGATIENYFFYFISASIFFGLHSNIISGSYNCLIGNENFIKKIYFPKSIFFLNIIALEVINFFLAFITLFIIALALGMTELTLQTPIAFLAVIISLPFLLGVGITVGIGAVFFRDLTHIIPAILQALYFLTPILYSVEMIPEEYRPLLLYNPLFYFVESFRSPLMASQSYNWSFLGYSCIISLLTMTFGFWLLKKMENKIVFKL